jgi:hypothetical protein
MIEAGLDFILNHLQESTPTWPRTVSTSATNKAQVVVYSKEEALAKFKQSDFLDCRINAYPIPSPVSNFLGINTISPTVIMIDIDRARFTSDKAHKLALSRTLATIQQRLDAGDGDGDIRPTVLWSGNGYHVIQPLDGAGVIFENIKELSDFRQPSVKFLRFAEWYLSNGKSDSVHNNTVSMKNCMLRIPGSFNSECIKKDKDSEVKIIHRFRRRRK